MSKFKIEIEIDVDFQKFFDDVPEELYDKSSTSDEYYEHQVISNMINNIYKYSLQNHLRWIPNQDYEYAKHHLLIEDEVSKQIVENYKIVSYIRE